MVSRQYRLNLFSNGRPPKMVRRGSILNGYSRPPTWFRERRRSHADSAEFLRARLAHNAGLESSIDDRELNGLRGVILVPKACRHPQRRFSPRPGPAKAAHRLGDGKFAAELAPRQIEPLRKAGDRCDVGGNAGEAFSSLQATNDQAIHDDATIVNPGEQRVRP